MPPSNAKQQTKKRTAKIAVLHEIEKALQASPSTAMNGNVIASNTGTGTNYGSSSNRYEHILRPRKMRNSSSAPPLCQSQITTTNSSSSTETNITVPPTNSPQQKKPKKAKQQSDIVNDDTMLPTATSTMMVDCVQMSNIPNPNTLTSNSTTGVRTEPTVPHGIIPPPPPPPPPPRTISIQTRRRNATSTPTHPPVLPVVTPHPTTTAMSTRAGRYREFNSGSRNNTTGPTNYVKYYDPKIGIDHTKLPPGVINIFPEKRYPTCSTYRHPSMIPVQRRDDCTWQWSSTFLSTYGPDYLSLLQKRRREQVLIDASRRKQRRQMQAAQRTKNSWQVMMMTKLDCCVDDDDDDDSDDLSHSSYGIQKRYSDDSGFDDDDDNDNDNDCAPARNQLPVEDVHRSNTKYEDDVDAEKVHDADQTQPGITARTLLEHLSPLSSDSDHTENWQSQKTATPTQFTGFIVKEHFSSGTHDSTPSPTKRRQPIPKSSVAIMNQPLLTTKMRRTLVLWMSEVCQEFQLSDATYHLSVTLVDQTLLYNPFHIRSEQFQAVGCVCLWIASKLEDVKPPSRNELSYISDFSVSDGQLVRMERHICGLLQFRLQHVTPFHFLPIFLRASSAVDATVSGNTFDGYDPIDVPMVSMVKYLLELSRSSYRLTTERPDLLAASCVYLALATLGIVTKGQRKEPKTEGLYWTNTLKHYTGFDVTDMIHTIGAIYMLQITAESAVSMGVGGGCPAYKKYGTRDHHCVSRKVPPRLEDLALPNLEIDNENYFKLDVWGIETLINN